MQNTMNLKTTHNINRIEATLRGLEYVETLKDGSFKAWNWSMDNALAPTHIDGIRHERSVCADNAMSRFHLAITKCPRMAKINSLL